MISNIVKMLASTAVKEGLKSDGIAVVIRNALLSASVGFAAKKVLEKTYTAMEKNFSSNKEYSQES